MLRDIEQSRLRVSVNTDAKYKALLGQFLTPMSTARFMAEMFDCAALSQCRLLDAGAGIGSLSAAFLHRCLDGELLCTQVTLEAYEIDRALCSELANTLYKYAGKLDLDYKLYCDDFILAAVNRIQFEIAPGFTHAILNPPYKKISATSRHRRMLSAVGIETVNLYSAFVALTILLMAPGGQIVAIIPRSFCNGAYYKSFREFLLARCAITRIHLFGSRDSAFQDDGVLQENVILALEVGGTQGKVQISTSTDNALYDLACTEHPFECIVHPNDSEKFIRIPVQSDASLDAIAPCTLQEIGVTVSTGPIVDFRLKEYLRAMPDSESAPLLYAAHFSGRYLAWPKSGIKKPNAIVYSAETAKWFYPNGYYCVVRRFSSKEERRRIVASVTRPSEFQDHRVLGFENHLNLFHEAHHGLNECLAKGLALYLNTTMVDTFFRQFSGHTQVNATDLRLLKYPSRAHLIALGMLSDSIGDTQHEIDNIVLQVCSK